jgi:mannitol/fructose-specific phosphotransferase system IIA component (Ntr-type)
VDERGVVGQNTAMSIAAFLDPRAVNLRLQSDNRDDVLRELVHLIPDLRDRAAEQIALWQSLVDREKLHTTAVGEGLAFPHARNAMGNLLKRPAIVIGRNDKGVSWGATDGKPVQIFFLLAAPSLTEHLHLLSQMSRLLRNAKTREELLRASEGAQAIEILKAAEAKLAG